MTFTRDLQLEVGSIFEGRYEIVSQLGIGSFGRVYKARQLSTGQGVAIKILRLRHGGSDAELDNQIERFRREMRLCVELSHPNIVRLIDTGESGEGTLYAVFEFVPGSTLKDVLAAERRLELREAIHLMSQVLDALGCAHARGVVHRDLKPENIMITQTGVRRNALVLDFGLGGFTAEVQGWGLPRLTATQEMMGTPCYAAPEQLRGEPPSVRSDLYSWGLTFLECLTGEMAVGGGSVQEAILKQLGPDPIPIARSIDNPRLRKLLETVTAKRVEKRDVTIEGLLNTLSVIESGEPVSQKGAVEPAADEGERRQVTVASCRLSVAGAQGQVLDIEEMDELITAQNALYAEVAAGGDGHVASAVGNRALLVFGYPHAREQDAVRAARAALAIAAEVRRRGLQLESERQVRLDVHIGVHTGLVITRELRRSGSTGAYDAVGPTPLIACQLDEMAEAGEVVASVDTHRLLRGEIESEVGGDCLVRDLGTTLPVFRLTAVRKVAGGVETFQSARETPLVGREQQLEQLLHTWEEVLEGKPAAVLMTGEAGIGKSRLIRELRRRVPAAAWLGARCVAENQNSPLHPIADLLSMLDESVEVLLARYDLNVVENVPLLAPLLSATRDEHPLLLTPDRRKELTLETLLTLLLRMATARPLVFAMEDLHWADPTTLDFVNLLVNEICAVEVMQREATPRLYLVFTARPHFTPTWSLENVAMMPLSRLGRREVEQMVRASLVSDAPVSDVLLDDVAQRSDGVPLFVEEITRVLLESSRERRESPEELAEVPGSLRGLLMARLDGVSASARETAQLAAVLGREIRYELLKAVSPKSESMLRNDVGEMSSAGLIHPRRSARSETYVFRHALLRDTAYEAMRRPMRQSLHDRVASTLRERFPEIERAQPEILAYHLELGGRTHDAADAWQRAGDRALKRGAFVESMRHLERGLDLASGLPPSDAVRRLEVTLTESLGTAQLATQGYGSPEVEKTFSRAINLCQELGEQVSFGVLYGVWGVHLIRSERETTAFLLERLREYAERTGEARAICTAQGAAGLRAFYRGKFERARDELTRACEWYNDQSLLEWIREAGYDGRLYNFAYLMWSLGFLGRTDEAIRVRDRMLALAPDSPSPYARAIALGFAANLAHDMDEPDTALTLSGDAIAHATQQKLPFYMAIALPVHGWALARQGELEQGRAEIEQGLGLLGMIGIRAMYGYYLGMRAEAALWRGAIDEGLQTVEEALGLSATLLDRFYEPELMRLKGALELGRARRVEAESCFRRAFELARQSESRYFALRAAVDLGCLLREEGRVDDARSLLGGICGQATEQTETASLRQARALLAEL